MSEEIQIRTVAVEFLRAGPPHNQLLSPLTQYLAVCGDAGAGVVTVPYEQAGFDRRLKELRYETGDASDRPVTLHDLGVEMGKLLGSVPGLPGALSVDPSLPATLVHLRLTLSASELAHLPFELAKVPVGPGATAETWLAIQIRPPVCLTRNIRTVSAEGVIWPDRPRILFISSDPGLVPFEEHRQALLNAIGPFLYPPKDGTDPATEEAGAPGTERPDRETFDDLLTVLKNPTLEAVLRECRKHRYTHVHILAHGDVYHLSPDLYGVALLGPEGESDIVSGERFATALTAIGEATIHRPTVVTVAACDSGNVGTVAIPGASFAHQLHLSGVPLVVASQFPLSMAGSVPLVRTLYEGLLWGRHPLVLLQRLRAELHARYTADWHDWASLVVYEALPQTLGQQLETLRYRQARLAMNAALERVDQTVSRGLNQPTVLKEAVDRAVGALPLTGPFGVEGLGLRASTRKRQAQAAFARCREAAGSPAFNQHLDLLDKSLVDYTEAGRRLLVNDETTLQRKATLHWVLVQTVCLAAALGRPMEKAAWQTAKYCADFYLQHKIPEERAWAHGSLAELHLLSLADPSLSEAARAQISDTALEHAEQLLKHCQSREDFPVKSTARQFRRYVDWWGHQDFAQGLAERGRDQRPSWDAVVAAAQRLVERLEGPSREAGSSSPPTTPTGTTTPSGGNAPLPPDGSGAAAPAGPATAAKGSRALGRARKAAAAPSRTGRFFDIEMLPAGHGDALWIEYGEGAECRRWLIDCGTQQTATRLLRRVDELPERDRALELFVMSHIDSDHIGGALPFLGAARQGLGVRDLWFNGWRHIARQLGARQGEMFSTAIADLALPWNKWRDGGPVVVPEDGPLPACTLDGGMTLTLLSPGAAQLRKLAPSWSRELKKYGLEPGSRVDYSRFLKGTPSQSTDVDRLADSPFDGDAAVANGSSIALLAEYAGAAALLAADAHAPVLVAAIRRLLAERGLSRLPLAAFKVPHHGSRNNLSAELLGLLDCRRYLFSSNGDHFCHPDREAAARVIKYGRRDGAAPRLLFNYRSRYNLVWSKPELQAKYGYGCEFPAGESGGLLVSLLQDG
jgi:beta-lactamase superfamily II metal-dependent hydrolase